MTSQLALKPGETLRINKNAVVISIAFMFHFTAYSVSVYIYLLHEGWEECYKRYPVPCKEICDVRFLLIVPKAKHCKN